MFLLKNPPNQTGKRVAKLANLVQDDLKTMRSCLLKEEFPSTCRGMTSARQWRASRWAVGVIGGVNARPVPCAARHAVSEHRGQLMHVDTAFADEAMTKAARMMRVAIRIKMRVAIRLKIRLKMRFKMRFVMRVKMRVVMRGHRGLMLDLFGARGAIPGDAAEDLNNKLKATVGRSCAFRVFRATDLALDHALARLRVPD